MAWPRAHAWAHGMSTDSWLRRTLQAPATAWCASGSPGSTAGTCRPGVRRPPLAAHAGAHAQRPAGALPAGGAPRAPAPAHGTICAACPCPSALQTSQSVTGQPCATSRLNRGHSHTSAPGTLLGAKGHVRRLEERSPIRRLPCPQDPAPRPEASTGEHAGREPGAAHQPGPGRTPRSAPRRAAQTPARARRTRPWPGSAWPARAARPPQRGARVPWPPAAQHALRARGLRCLSTCITLRQRGLGLPGSRMGMDRPAMPRTPVQQLKRSTGGVAAGQLESCEHQERFCRCILNL